MSYKIALCAGLLVIVAAAIPRYAAPVADVRSGVRVVASAASVPGFVPAPVTVAPAPITADAGPPVSDAVYGDAKTADFDPEHPPARMGEPG